MKTVERALLPSSLFRMILAIGALLSLCAMPLRNII